ncbi:50S ribosomal protein L13 [Labilibacter sediminis]|nr:50S ribosomal protein L13 [Labilibacter sediminis]
MNTLSYKTVSANKATANKEWVVVDATDMVVGRLASKVAKLLRGKYKPNYTPHVDCGDNVIILNADKVRLTGNKWEGRTFYYHSGFPGGRTDVTPAELFAKSPERLVERAVKGMLPKSRLGRQLFSNLFVYVGGEHKQEAQKPKSIDLNLYK